MSLDKTSHPKKACSYCGAGSGKPCVTRSSGAARGQPHKQRMQNWVAPRERTERARLRAKADRTWPHPKGTLVTYYPVRRRGELEGDPSHTKTRTGSFFSDTGDVVVFLDKKAGYVLATHLVVRALPPCEPHWSDR